MHIELRGVINVCRDHASLPSFLPSFLPISFFPTLFGVTLFLFSFISLLNFSLFLCLFAYFSFPGIYSFTVMCSSLLTQFHTFRDDTMCKGKGKVVPILFLTEHHAMKAYWGVEV
jgi:hypothetical protein